MPSFKQLCPRSPLIAVVCGSGQVAHAAVAAQAELLFVLNAGYYRSVMGVGSQAALMPYGNANDQTERILEKHVLPAKPTAPIVAGLFAADPTVPVPARLDRFQNLGVQGVINWPPLGLWDGQYRKAIEAEEFNLQTELQALQVAQARGLVTFGFAFNGDDACVFAEGGVDAVVLGLGLTQTFDDVYQHRDQVQQAIARANAWVAQVRRIKKSVPVIVFGGPVTTAEDVEQLLQQTAVDGFAGGSAFDRLPVESMLRSTVGRFRAVAEHLRNDRGSENLGALLGRSGKMAELFQTIKRVAPFDVNVCIEGESGTGKELIATQLHRMSPRAQQAFVTLNCGAIPDSLLESELFGHEKGAFTGADRRRLGKFELAHRGTLLLDEVADLSPRGQVALLRAIQQGEINRVGGDTYIPVDVRILAASNQPLAKLVEEGRFRSDLYHRLNHLTLQAPPLRERTGDIPLLAEDILVRLRARLGRKILGLSPRFQEKLAHHRWPGNVRELQHVLMRAALLEDSPVLEGLFFTPAAAPERPKAAEDDAPQDLAAAKKNACKEAVEKALRDHNGNKSLAAQSLGISRKTLYAWLNS
jgi:two-component system response regulator HydG